MNESPMSARPPIEHYLNWKLAALLVAVALLNWDSPIRAAGAAQDAKDAAELVSDHRTAHLLTVTVATVTIVTLSLWFLKCQREAREEFDQFFELSPDILGIAGPDGRFKRVSPAVREILGWTPAEFIAHRFLEFVHPEDQAKAQQELQREDGSAAQVSTFQTRCRHKNKSWRVLAWRSTPQPGGLTYATARDITELKQTEQALREANEELRRSRSKLQNIFESLPGLYLILTKDLNIVTASDAYLQATMTRRDDIRGRPLFEVFPDNPDDPSADGVANLRSSLRRVIQNQTPDTMAIQKYDVRRADGTFEERFWSPINSPVLGENGELELIIHRVEDVTEFVLQKRNLAAASDHQAQARLRARLEAMEAEIFQSSQAVQTANQKLLAANQELEAFSYSVSHDLRAPLRHINGYVEMLMAHLDGTLTDKARRYLTVVSESATQMGQLIDDLLEFSRMGRKEMRQGTVSLNALIQESIHSLQDECKGRQIVWKVSPLPDVIGDVAMLQQVVVNLLSNAVKYTRHRSPAQIEVRLVSTTNSEAVVAVQDNGAGFEMKYVNKLFGVFQRLHRAEDFEGTGVGLANVRRIVSRHGGRVWAEGTPDVGATFYFSLPLAKGNQ